MARRRAPTCGLPATLCLLLLLAGPQFIVLVAGQNLALASADARAAAAVATAAAAAAVAAGGSDVDAETDDTVPGTFCHPESAEALESGSAKPIPCTTEQEGDALADLWEDTPLVTDVESAVFDTSQCSPADPEGFTVPVNLMDLELLEVVTEVAEDFLIAMGNSSFWGECEGDATQDAYNACAQPQPQPQPTMALPGAEQEVQGTHYKIEMKVGCSVEGVANDTVALQAYAFFQREGGNESNETVTGIEWELIELPPEGQ